MSVNRVTGVICGLDGEIVETFRFDYAAREPNAVEYLIERVRPYVAGSKSQRMLGIGDLLLPTRYRLDGTEAGDDEEQWWDFQLDGYGMWLWALARHIRRHACDARRWTRAAALTVAYLARFWTCPCYDWWEEHREHRHPSTLAAIHAGLSSALDLHLVEGRLADQAAAACAGIRRQVQDAGMHNGHLVKWLGGREIDASLIACFTPFALLPADGPVASATVEAIEHDVAHGGVHRYADDTFYGGGEWPLLAALLGWHYARAGRTAEAWRQLAWVVTQATTAGDLPEQSSVHLLHPERHQYWVDRWGPVAAPLLWSHAMFLILAAELGITAAGPPDQPDREHGIADERFSANPPAVTGRKLRRPASRNLATEQESAPAGPRTANQQIRPIAPRTYPAQGRRPPTPVPDRSNSSGQKPTPSRARPHLPAAGPTPADTPPRLPGTFIGHALHCTLLAVDIAAFGDARRDDEVRLFVRSSMYTSMSQAFDDIGFDWEQCHHEDRGDGVLIVIGAQTPPMLLLDPLILNLRSRLRHHSKMASAAAQIRMRMAMHNGPIHFDGNGVAGQELIHLFRILDAPALRRALAESPSDLAFAASDNFYNTMIKPSSGGLIHPGSYRQIEIAHKETSTHAWLLTTN